jgi:predicted nucleic acid-binding protein
MNPKDRLHQVAKRHLESISRDSETLLPASTSFEFDLVLKGRSYTFAERESALDWLASSIPSDKVVSNSLASLRRAVELQEGGMGYFDSMISSLAITTNAVVITTDKEISKVVKTDW